MGFSLIQVSPIDHSFLMYLKSIQAVHFQLVSFTPNNPPYRQPTPLAHFPRLTVKHP